MTALSRRSFSRLVVASLPAAILLPKVAASDDPQTAENSWVPRTIAGHSLTEEEKELVTRFTASQDKNLSPLRKQDLPNGFPPTFVPLPVTAKSGKESR